MEDLRIQSARARRMTRLEVIKELLKYYASEAERLEIEKVVLEARLKKEIER